MSGAGSYRSASRLPVSPADGAHGSRPPPSHCQQSVAVDARNGVGRSGRAQGQQGRAALDSRACRESRATRRNLSAAASRSRNATAARETICALNERRTGRTVGLNRPPEDPRSVGHKRYPHLGDQRGTHRQNASGRFIGRPPDED